MKLVLKLHKIGESEYRKMLLKVSKILVLNVCYFVKIIFEISRYEIAQYLFHSLILEMFEWQLTFVPNVTTRILYYIVEH